MSILRTMLFMLTLATPLLALGCADESLAPAPLPACYERQTASTDDLCALLPDACPQLSGLPALSEATTVVPDEANMPAGIVSQHAHNNLDVVWHRGRLFFAFRTAPSHFADDEVVMYVVSTTDQQTWTLETSIALGKDLREPRFLTLGDRLFLYLARLGEVTLTFKPESMMVTEQQAGCVWSEPVDIEPTGEPGFIPWRAREIDGVGYLIGYVGGENIYDMASDGIRVHWLKTSDGYAFEPAVGSDSVVLSGGVSETDWAFVDDGGIDGGGLVAVTRNEAGDADGFGSKICRASAGDLGSWSCSPDPKKYVSPVLFRHGSEVYLIGRRQLANDGNFDLDRQDLAFEDRGVEYQTTYWSTPKRCALWRVDADTLSVEWVLDLPSNGDTCFASVLPLSPQHYLIYNYTSPLDDPELSWSDGQWGDTYIYRITLMLP